MIYVFILVATALTLGIMCCLFLEHIGVDIQELEWIVKLKEKIVHKEKED